MTERSCEWIFYNFRKLTRSRLVENYVIIFLLVMGDHGNRFDKIRQTLIGRYEERMPYLSVFLPDWFRIRYSSAVANLNSNVWRLSCQFDVYETLVDILNKRFGDEKRPRLKNRGHSLFSSIPKSRTCREADIGEHYCVCQNEDNLDIRDNIVRSAADYVVKIINENFLERPHARKLCTKLRLKQILSAQKYKATDSVKHAKRYHYKKLLSNSTVAAVISNLRITFITSPNDAVYEALAQYEEPNNNASSAIIFRSTNLDISRVNAYGSQGYCVSKLDRDLRKFCMCS